VADRFDLIATDPVFGHQIGAAGKQEIQLIKKGGGFAANTFLPEF
jgi:hypothetical protein